MASRRLSNGRSPLVNQQRQITSFFAKSSSSPSSVPSKQTPKSVSNPSSSKPIIPDRSPSPSPTTPSPLQSKHKKPLLVIGPSQLSPPPTPHDVQPNTPLYGQEVVNRRIKVFWPLDKSWYEGSVKYFDKASGKHVVQYDDAEEEMLDLAKEKTEWCDEVTPKLRRLRRRVNVIEDEATPNAMEVVDDSTDEDWGKCVNMEAADDDDDDVKDMELEGEEENIGSASKTCGKNSALSKRTINEGWKLGIFSKKIKSVEGAKKSASKVSMDHNSGKMMELKGSGCK